MYVIKFHSKNGTNFGFTLIKNHDLICILCIITFLVIIFILKFVGNLSSMGKPVDDNDDAFICEQVDLASLLLLIQVQVFLNLAVKGGAESKS